MIKEVPGYVFLLVIAFVKLGKTNLSDNELKEID